MEPDEAVALVCNGLHGTGRAVAAELLRRNWKVAVQDACDDTEKLAWELAQQTGAGERLVAFAGDVAADAQREELVEFVLDQFDRLALLVGPAPTDAPPPAATDLLELAAGDIADALAAGVVAPMNLAQRVANEMIRLIDSGQIEEGKIVFFGSIAAYTSSPDQGLTCLAAGGIATLNRLFADRLAAHGVNVYEVRLGLMATRRDEPGHRAYQRLIDDGLTPIRRWGRPSDAALAVAAIADDALRFSTGEVINVDGGFHLRRL